MSVLFVDLVGFTSYSEGRDPEDVRSMITAYFDLAREVVERFGGTVDKFIGDAVMAWWGATTSNEDDAERAVRASLELVDRVQTMGESLEIDGLAARVGVMTGEVSVGPGGNERGLLLGDLVNTASRLQSLAEPGTVLVGEATASLVSTAIEVTPAGSHQLKGREQPVTAFRAERVLAERGGRGRSDFLEPPFVGRSAELRLLKDALHAAGQDRHVRLVSLIGQAGIGKSRLVWEFLKYIDGLVEVVYWHEGRSPSYGDGIAMWALGEMVRQRAGIQESDDDAATLERLEDMVGTYVSDDRNQTWVQERLAALLGVGTSMGTERTELFAAARMLFEGIAAHGTVVLVFEDLHWADPALLEFIDDLPDWSQNHPILVVTLSRPDLLDRRPEWGSGRRGLSSTYLGPLADDEIKEMVQGAVPGIPGHAVDHIITAAGGVPLFAVEVLRMLMAEGRLVIGASGVEVTDDLTQLEVPKSVHAVVAARLDRLSTEERELTRNAAVLGQTFTLPSLAALSDEEPDKLERRLGELVRREIFELIRDPRSPERGQYRWVQSVLREVAYGRVSKGDRHELHLRVARHLRSLDESELAPVVASHFVAATEAATNVAEGLQAELSEALHAAIGRASVLHAHEQILGLVESAIAVAPAQLEIDLHEIGARAAVRLGDDGRANAHCVAAMQLAETSDDLALLHRAVALSGRVANQLRQSDVAVGVLEPHLVEHPDFESDPSLARASVYLARARLLLGDEQGAAELADRSLGAVEGFDLIDEIADALVTRGTALTRLRPRQGMALLYGALDITRHHGLTDVMLRCLTNIGYATRDHEEAIRVTEEAFAEATRVGDRSHASFVAGNLAGEYLGLMEHDKIERLLAEPVWRTAEEINHKSLLADLRARRGDFTGAEEALALARRAAVDITDKQTLMTLERSEAALAMFEGRGREAFETGHRHATETAFLPDWSVMIATAGACVTGDETLLAEAAKLAAGRPTSPLNTASRGWIAAIQHVVRGEIDSATAMIDETVESLQSHHLVWLAFQLPVVAARHMPADHPKRAEYIARSQETAARTGAPGLGVWIERMTA
ncbi:MAG: adenylate/guanylate cyclase domain-containing protein [Acidimicrobiia bacterium]